MDSKPAKQITILFRTKASGARYYELWLPGDGFSMLEAITE